MGTIRFLLFILFLIKICYNEKNNFLIKIINEKDLTDFINPLNQDEDNIYISIGSNLKDKLSQRTIFEFNSTGALVKNFSFTSTSDYINTEVGFINDIKDYIVIISSSSIELIDIEDNKIITTKAIDNTLGYRTPIKQLDGNNYLFAYKQKNGNVVLNKLLFENDEIKEVNTKKIDNISTNKSIISCDTTYDNQYILCVYFNEKNQLEIASFSSDLQIIKKKIDESNILDTYFIKIVYFKDQNKFVVFNSLNETYTRLRYFKYKNNFFLNQLTFITDDENDYLDEDITQLSPYHNHNDIISFNSSKIIRISVNSNDILISRYQFYNDDTSLSIKNCKLNDVLINNDYSSFNNPRLSLLDNIIVVCLSTMYLNEKKTGYFFINYPKSQKMNKDSNNDINVNELITIENNIFQYIPKIRIMEIPEGFIFNNSLSDVIIDRDELEYNDTLIFQEYKNFSLSSLKYEVLAIKNKNENDQGKVYPPGSRKMGEESEIIINGEIGQININISTCSNGFLPLEDNDNVCTKIQHEGYYPDYNNKIYKKCYSDCKTCNGPLTNDSDMNCEICKDNFYKKVNTNSCYNETPSGYYLDFGEFIFKKCHKTCSECFGPLDINCYFCIENYTFIVSNNSCIFLNNSKTNDNYEISIQLEGRFRWLFIFIFLVSLILGAILILRPLRKIELQSTRYTFIGNNNLNEERNPVKKEVMQEMPLLNW